MKDIFFLFLIVFANIAHAQPMTPNHSSEILEKALSCSPEVTRQAMCGDRRIQYNNDITRCTQSGRTVTYKVTSISFNSGPCALAQQNEHPFQSDNQLNTLRDALLVAYGGFTTDESINALKTELERRQKLASTAFTQNKQRDEELIQERKRQIKSGKVTILNFEDAWLFHDTAKDISSIMRQPLLRPDSAIYWGLVTIDGEEQKDVLRIRLDLPGYSGPDIRYSWLRTSNKTVNFAPSMMRISGQIAILGRYINNQKYNTVIGEQRTAPVIDVLFIDSGEKLIEVTKRLCGWKSGTVDACSGR